MDTTFFSFIKNKNQLSDWLILLISCIVGYISIRICYPYPATISDSGTYVVAAMRDSFTIYRPFGYSFFLQIIHAFSSSINSILASQTILYFIAASLFALRLKYYYPPKNKILWRVLLFLFIFSPMHFFMANAIMSDLLFASLIYLMLTAYLLIVNGKSYIGLACFLMFLFAALHTRYSAIIFPIVFIFLFFFIKDKIRWISIIATIIISFVFYNQVKTNMKATVGLNQYSTGFDGWQLASNAMHIVPFIDLKPENIKDPNIRAFHNYILQNKDVILKETKNGTDPSYMFIWANDLPLKQFFSYQLHHSQSQGQPVPYPIMWSKLGGGLYKDYGQYLILRHPFAFMQYYYLPNAKQIFYPTKTGMLGHYNAPDGKDIKDWYNIPNDADLAPKYPIYKTWLADSLSIYYLLIWITIMAITIIAIIYRKQIKWNRNEKIGIGGILLFGFIYYASTVFASPIEFRFWLPMSPVQFIFIYIFANKIISARENKKLNKTE